MTARAGPGRGAAALLARVESLLREELALEASGRARYLALLCANAVGAARREQALSARIAALEADIAAVEVEAVRAGAHDADAALHARLTELARLRAFIANPETLRAEERARLEDALADPIDAARDAPKRKNAP